jgi:NAD(P)-dependent dehydrogenase (short-subunit alcohol dehydrogenase family)
MKRKRCWFGTVPRRIQKRLTGRRLKVKLKDKVAIITGSAQGIGAALAVGFAREGAKLVIADILDGKRAVADVEKAGSEAIFVKTDVTKQEECDSLAKAAVDRFGTIDILVNNAAIFGDIVMKPFTDVSDEEWDRLMAVNVKGPFHCCKSVFPYMKEKGGKIINMSSASIMEGVPFMPHYVASKGAIMAFTRAMARELGDHKINVNSIAPGFTHSEGGDRFDHNKAVPIPLLEELQLEQRCIKRAAVPEDLVGTAVFLASHMSDFISGQLIVHDGGISLH